MRQVPENIQRIVDQVVSAMGYELVGVEFNAAQRNGILRVYIDTEQGVTLDDCQAVSHQLSGVLDVEDPIKGNYSLEISSPGLDRPIFKAKDFDRFAGQRVKIKLSTPQAGRRNFSGQLQGMRDEDVVLLEDGNEIHLPFNRIDTARLVPEF